VANEIRVLTDDFITVPEAAKQLGKPKMTLYRWIGSNKLIAVTFGGILFIPKSEVERLKLSSK
jgi:excisionase family DNA binding protein